MKEIILHPSRNFLDARNPSSPFQYRKQMAESCWRFIDEKATPEGGLWNIKINDGLNDYYYFEKTKADMFVAIKHHFI